MAYLLLLLALVAAAAGIALWRIDARQRAAASLADSAVQPAPTGAGSTPEEESAAEVEFEAAPEGEESADVDPVALRERESAPADPLTLAAPGSIPVPAEEKPAVVPTPEEEVPPVVEPVIEAPAPTPAPESPVELEPEPEPVPEPKPEPEPRPNLTLVPESEPTDREEESEEEPKPVPEPPVSAVRTVKAQPPASAPVQHRSSGLQLPGATRRERKSWAESHGFTFTRTDEYLVDEWRRGAASTGAPARDIVIGDAFGHELLLMDLGGINVMAMRTGSASDVVVDCRRADSDEEALGEGDLVLVDRVEGFNIYGTLANTTRRFLDIRVRMALQSFPQVVTAVWLESDWALAQTVRGTKAEDWDAMLAPLALIADAARVLPPRGGTEPELKLTDYTPSREMEPLPADALLNQGSGPAHTPATPPPAGPPVMRPDDPIELPSRSRAQARGVVEPSTLGGDEVDAIADGRGPSAPDPTRMPRRPDPGPSIFDD